MSSSVLCVGEMMIYVSPASLEQNLDSRYSLHRYIMPSIL